MKHLALHVNKLTLIPPLLKNIPQPPDRLWHSGALLNELLARPRVAIVGSRKVSPYGRLVTEQLAAELAGQGIVIVSGLALGVDCIAHEAALRTGGLTIAVLPSPIEDIAPATNRPLAQRIIEKGGALISEYQAGTQPYKYNFVERNRLVSGLADAVLIPEAAIKSGSLHTANFAFEQGRDVMVVPGNITSPTSAGSNNLLKTGAHPITCTQDVLHVLGLTSIAGHATAPQGSTPQEQLVLSLLFEGVTEADQLLNSTKLEPRVFNQTLSMLEITGKVRPQGGNRWTLS